MFKDKVREIINELEKVLMSTYKQDGCVTSAITEICKNKALAQLLSLMESELLPRITPEQLHIWYLEATSKLHPENFNSNAQKLYEDLTEEQKFIDKYIADKIHTKCLHEIKERLCQKE